ncbi:MAG: hypothetical protein Q9166_002491 [cf. Caloplaca sp. 2 TL-2023]
MSWSCADEQDLKLDLSSPGKISVSPRFPTPNNRICFGPQLPKLDAVPLQLMGDKDGMEKGPAWWFQQSYTKVVVVRGVDFNANGEYASEEDSKRRFDVRQVRKERRQSIAPATAKPWFCYWNNTILEGFIYVTQNFSGQYQSVSSDYSASSDPIADQGAAADYGSAPFLPFSFFTPSPTGSLEKRQSIDPSQLAAYSKDIKIEERRAPNTVPSPYCVHMQIMNDGTASPIPDDSGNPQTIQLVETPSTYDDDADQPTTQKGKRENLWQRDPPRSACECEWASN